MAWRTAETSAVPARITSEPDDVVGNWGGVTVVGSIGSWTSVRGDVHRNNPPSGDVCHSSGKGGVPKGKPTVMTDTVSVPAQGPVLMTRPLVALYVIALLAGIGVGMFNPLISVLLEQRAVETAHIGFLASSFFLMVAIGAPLVERLLRVTSLRFTMSLGFAVTSIAAVAFPFQDGYLSWLLVRDVMGIGSAFFMIAGQAALNRYADDNNRALINGLYGLSFGIGMGIGPLCGPYLFAVSPLLAFSVGGGVMATGVIAAYWGLPGVTATLDRPSPGLWRWLKTPLAAVLAYGFAEAALLTMYPLFLTGLGYAPEECGWSLTAFIVGGVVGTVTMTPLADRVGHTRVLRGCILLGIAALIAILAQANVVVTSVLSLVAGLGFGPVFVLALALTGATLEQKDLAAGCALFTIAFGIGSTFGPWLSGLSLDYLGVHHVFTPTIAIFVMALVVQMFERPRQGRVRP